MEPTIEDYQARILELESENEQLKTQAISDKQKITSTESELSKARALNSNLLNKIPITKETPTNIAEPEPHVETVDEFINDFVEQARNRLVQIYGVDNVADKHR